MFFDKVQQLFPSMFHRRLLLLAAMILLSMALLVLKIGHLTVVKGSELKAQAEARLVRHQWTPTVRGEILDRKGRVLARDRASYDVALSYPMLAGEWAKDRARAFAKSFYREQWHDLNKDQRQEHVERALPVYIEHVENTLDELARLGGLTRADLDAACTKIRDEVERMQAQIVRKNRDDELKAAGERGELVTPELTSAIEKRVNQPIREMKIPHRVLYRLSDQSALNLRLELDDQTELTPLPGETGPREKDLVDRLPGVSVFDAGDREYPYESQRVTIDFANFPTPLRRRPGTAIRVDGVASHILGWMRDDVFKENNDARKEYLRLNLAADKEARLSPARETESDSSESRGIDRGEYRDGDRVGESGAEAGYENTLRGLRGWRTRQLDTDSTSVLEAKPGRDVRLTVDIVLQAKVQAIMDPMVGLAIVQPWHRVNNEPANPTMPDGTPITGSAVVLDVDTGEIIAMVSTPEMPRATMKDSLPLWDRDVVNLPKVNRAINRGYPPGSIVKPLILCGAVEREVYALNQHIACTGHLFPNDPNTNRCWIYKHFGTTHNDQLGHDLEPTEAIMVSCNIFFFTLGKRLGVDGIVGTYRDFGVGSSFGLNIGPEYAGALGKGRGGQGLTAGDSIQMGIGQGPVTWTPLHAAQAYATLARYGFVISPRIDRDAPKSEPVDLRLDSRAVSAALEGLRRSTNENLGTGNHLTFSGTLEPIFNAPGVDVIGKTGTAAAPRIFAPRPKLVSSDPSGDGSENSDDRPSDHDGVNPTAQRAAPDLLRAGDHSWFVVLVGPHGDRPRYAISVVMDYAGSGGKVSGPIVNQIIHALVAEGYL